MSVSGKKGRVGIPILLLHDCQGMIVTVETRSHETYRGLLDDTEDNWNMTLRNATWTKRDGSKTRLGAVFIRGSSINFMIAPKIYPGTAPAPTPAPLRVPLPAARWRRPQCEQGTLSPRGRHVGDGALFRPRSRRQDRARPRQHFQPIADSQFQGCVAGAGPAALAWAGAPASPIALRRAGGQVLEKISALRR